MDTNNSPQSHGSAAGVIAIPGKDLSLRNLADGKISTIVVKCLHLFRQLLTLDALDQGEEKRPIAANLRDEETRFRVWSGNIGAHKKGRGSLDYRLRDASHIQKQVINLLEDLTALVGDAVAILTGQEAPWDEMEDDDGALGPEEDFDDSIPDTELEQIAVDVVDVVNCLLRLSVSIRNPAPHNRFVASASTETSHYEPFDIQHVKSKFGGTINEDLAVRLGKAISRRRQYFKYRETHHAKLSHGLDPETASQDAISTVASSIPRGLKDAKAKAIPNQPVEVVNEDARSDAGVSETSFATSVAEAAKLRVPPLPKEAEKGPFECPFCFTMITATSSISWKRHVYGDLRPYICLDADCPTPYTEFTRRHEWLEHEVRNHWKVYHCPCGCDDNFPSVAECKAHICATHPDAIPDSQLDAMVNLSARTLQVDEGITCRLCGEPLLSLKQYQRHVGRHQEQLSLFALPSLDQVDQDGDNGQRSDESDDGNGSDDGDDDHKNAVGMSGDDDGSDSTAKMSSDGKSKAVVDTHSVFTDRKYLEAPSGYEGIREHYSGSEDTISEKVTPRSVVPSNNDVDLSPRPQPDYAQVIPQALKHNRTPSPSRSPTIPSPSAYSTSSAMNRYWIPHLDIHKEVITQEIQYYLGPEATVRPYTREGEDGFLITTLGPCLTDEQIDDICVKSKEQWEREAASRASSSPASKQLKRPLHQPVVISSRAAGRRIDDRNAAN